MEGKDEKATKGLNKTQIILIVGFVALIAAVGVGAYFIIRNQNNAPAGAPGADTGNLVVDESNLTSVGQDLQSSVDDGMFEVSMNTIWNFPDGESASSDAYVANASGNHYPITFDILINETETIYSSTVIPVGNRIKEIKLDKDLGAGTYEAVCQYHLWKEDGTENSQFGVNITLNVMQ